MASCAAPLDLDDHRVVRYLGSNADHRTDLSDGAGLERDVRDLRVGEFGHQRHGLVELRDTSRDDDTVDRRAVCTCLLHEAFAADLQLPQVGVEEEGVELRLTARLEEFGQLGDVVGEDALGHLSATGQLGPVSGIGGRGHDRGVDRCRRHSGEEHRRSPGETGERGLHHVATVGKLNDLGAVSTPRALDIGDASGREQVALPTALAHRDQADALPADHGNAQPGGDVAGAQVEDPLGAGTDDVVEGVDPVDLVDQHCRGESSCGHRVDAAHGSPVGDEIAGGLERRMVEGDRHRQRIEDRREGGAAGRLLLAFGGFCGGERLALADECRQVARSS